LVKESVVVPAKPESTIEVTTYGCDECEFWARTSAEMLEHFGEKHAKRDLISYNGIEAMPFNAEADARLWLGRERSRSIRLSWEGSGFYVLKEYSEPCGHGCCDREVSELVPVQTFLYDLHEEGCEKLRAYLHIRNELRSRGIEVKR